MFCTSGFLARVKDVRDLLDNKLYAEFRAYDASQPTVSINWSKRWVEVQGCSPESMEEIALTDAQYRALFASR